MSNKKIKLLSPDDTRNLGFNTNSSNVILSSLTETMNEKSTSSDIYQKINDLIKNLNYLKKDINMMCEKLELYKNKTITLDNLLYHDIVLDNDNKIKYYIDSESYIIKFYRKYFNLDVNMDEFPTYIDENGNEQIDDYFKNTSPLLLSINLKYVHKYTFKDFRNLLNNKNILSIKLYKKIIYLIEQYNLPKDKFDIPNVNDSCFKINNIDNIPIATEEEEKQIKNDNILFNIQIKDNENIQIKKFQKNISKIFDDFCNKKNNLKLLEINIQNIINTLDEKIKFHVSNLVNNKLNHIKHTTNYINDTDFNDIDFNDIENIELKELLIKYKKLYKEYDRILNQLISSQRLFLNYINNFK